MVHMPFVQRFMGSQIASVLSDKLKTEVSVGRVDVGFLNRLTIDNVVVKDQQHEDLLRANRLSVKIAIWPLFSGQVRISSAQLFGAQLSLYREQADSQPNWQFVLDALSSKDSNSSSQAPDVTINSLIIRSSSLAYHQRDVQPAAAHTFNPCHVSVGDISAHIVLKQFTADSIDVNVKRLAFAESSGLQISRFTAHLQADRSKARLSNLLVQLPATQLHADSISATYQLEHLLPTLKLSGKLTDTYLTPSDFSALWPVLSAFHTTIDLSGHLEAGNRHLVCHDLSAADREGDFALRATGHYDDGQWQGTLSQFELNDALLSQVQAALPQLPAPLSRLTHLALSGSASSSADGIIEADTHMRTNVGNLTGHLVMADRHSFTADISTDSLDLHQLLANEQLGSMATRIHITGQNQHYLADATVNHLIYKGYTYRDIAVQADIAEGGDIAGNISIADPHLTTTLEGVLHRKSHATAIRLIGSVGNLSPARLNWTHQWGEASLSGMVDADISATSLNDAEGTIDIDDFVITPSDSTSTTYRMDNLHIRSGYDDGLHFVRADGDMGTAELKGQFEWSTLPQSFISYLASRLPTLPGLPSQPKKSATTANDFELELRLTDARWLHRIFNIPVSLQAPLTLQAMVNDAQNDVDIVATLPAFTYNGSGYTNGRIAISSEGDSTNCNACLTHQMPRTEEEHLKGKHDRELLLQLTARAGNNYLTTSLNFDNYDLTGDQTTDMRGTINAITQLYTNEQGTPEAQIRVLPSQLLMQGADWYLEPCDMLFTRQRLTVDQFTLRHADQHLIVDGIASQQASDTLLVDLKEINVAYLLELINFRSMRLDGNASGNVWLTALFGSPAMSGQLQVDDFTFLNGHMGTLYADAEWNSDARQIELSALATDGPEAVTHIDGYIAPSPRKEINLHIRAEDTHIGFIQSFTKSFLSDIEGKAWGELRISGPLNQMNLTGSAVVNGRACLTPMGTVYTMRDDTLRFTPDGQIRFDNFRLYDRDGHLATMNGSVQHRHLKNFIFDFSVDTDQFLVYHHPGFLYDALAGSGDMAGIIVADGHANIRGLQGETVINCNVTPLKGSVFAYNTASPDAINNQQFITWGTHSGSVDAVQAAKPAKNSSSMGGDLRINFQINATPDVSLRLLMDQHTGDYITLEGDGTINAAYYNKGPFQMFGTYTVHTGTYGITIQNILKKNFTFQDGGTVVFGGNPFDAQLNLRASHTVNGVSLSDLNIGNSFTNNTVRVNCLMNIQGQAGAPTVEFDMEMPTVNTEEQQMIRSIIASEQELNQQVLYLLGIGRFYTQGANNATSQQYDQTQLAMQSLLSGTVSSQINEVLSQVIKSNDWNFGANISTGNEGWHNAEYEGLVSGRLLNNRLLINGQFGYRDNATQATPSFIGDFDVRYLLTPSGNLALKVYNQTNDRYFTRSSLNTQGVGIIVKRDFNGLGDLFHPHRKKK